MAAVDLSLAFDYPYDIPDAGFVFESGHGIYPFEPGAGWTTALSDRVAVLAVGSNAAPSQLARKFPDAGDVIPVARVEVSGIDVVYAARFTRYGAVPATISDSPGTTARVHVTFLDEAQLAVMNRSEGVGRGVYELVPLSDGQVHVLGAGEWDGRVHAYRASDGPLIWEGSELALAAVKASERAWPELAERDLLTSLAGSAGMVVEEFVRRLVTDDAWRESTSSRLLQGGRRW